MWNCIAQADGNSPADAASDVQCCGGSDFYKKSMAVERERRRKAFVEAFGASSDAFDSVRGGDGMWFGGGHSSSSSSSD